MRHRKGYAAVSGKDNKLGRLFVSYSRKNKAKVYPFTEALTKAGIEIWIDREEIDPLDDFPARIRDGLARSHVLLAWYSPEYPQSNYCQKELTAAWICAQRLTRDVLSRILILNPGDGVAHIALGDVERQNYLSEPKDKATLTACIQSIKERLIGFSADFAAVHEFKVPGWHPSAQQGSTRFVGRLRELWRIHTSFNPVGISEYECPSVMVQLTGLGGVGKSLLAIEYAKRFGAAYPGGIHWLRAHGFDPQKPMEAESRERERQRQIEDLALLHDIPLRDKDFREIRRDLGRKLAAGEPYLWIVDDLPPGLDQEQGLPGWCAPSANGRTLVTTRSKDYAGLGVSLEIDVLEPEPAYELLTQKRKPQTERESEAMKDLAEDLGRHALALDVAGHFLLEGKGFAALRDELAAAKSDPLGEIVAGLEGQLPGGHEKSIVLTLLQSVRLLKEEGLSLLRLVCELHGGTPISYQLAEATFASAFKLSGPAAEVYRQRAVNQLKTHSLATISLGGEAGDALSVHALVRYTMLHGDPAKKKALPLRKVLREAAVSALGDLLEGVNDIRNHTRLELYVTHAVHLVPSPRTADEAWLATRLARFERERGNSHAALAMTKEVVPILARVLGVDHPITLTARHNIAVLTGETGDPQEALRLSRELLPDQARVLGSDHRDTLKTRGSIAGWTGETGEAEEALQLFHELLPDQARVLGSDHRDTLTTRSNIAVWTGRSGNAQEALRLFRELLPDQARVLGSDHPATLAMRDDIAVFTGETGDAKEALRLFHELLPILARVLGDDHPITLTTRVNITAHTGQTGHLKKALRLSRKLLPDLVRVLGADHPTTLTAQGNIACWTVETGDRQEALRLFRKLLPDLVRVFGADHPGTANAREWIRFLEDREPEP